MLYIGTLGAAFVGICPGGFVGMEYPLGAPVFGAFTVGIVRGGSIAEGAVAGGGIVVRVARCAIAALLFG